MSFLRTNSSLTPLQSLPTVKTLLSLDSEDNSRGKFIRSCVYDGSDYHLFEEPKRNIEWLYDGTSKIANGKPLYCFACNLEYDLVNVFKQHLDLLDVTFSPSHLIKARLKGRNIWFYDTLNHTALSVKAMGEFLGYEKLEHNPYSIPYLKRDSLIVFLWVSELQRFYNKIGCELKSTIASSSLDLFRRKYLSYAVKRISTYRKLVKESYYGGRTEVFNISPIVCEKGEFLYYADVNSLYPAVMYNHNFPNPNFYYQHTKFNPKQNGVVSAKVQSPETYLPILPIRHNHKLIFPSGVFSGTWTVPEFQYALENGYKIIELYGQLVYPYDDKFFESYVEDLYSERQKADGIFEFFLKIMMNSLYGKFAESNIVFTLSKDLSQGLRVFNNMVLKKKFISYPTNSNVIWSSYITSFGRIALHKFMMKLLNNGAKLIYCDTDSIVYLSRKPIIKFSRKLGDLKLEGRFLKGEFRLPKLYYMANDEEEIYHCKGVPVVKAEEFFIQGETVYERPNRLRESITHGLEPNVWRLTKKRSMQKYDKRKVLKNGDTKPLTLEVKNG